MLTTGIFKVCRFDYKIKKIGQPIYLRPFSDVHRDSPACDVDRWKAWLSQAKAHVNNSIFLGLGDYNDLASTSERIILGTRALHESTKQTLEDIYDQHIERFAKEIDFMKGRLIGLVNGNHYAEFSDGTNSDMRLARLMKTTFLGVAAFIRLYFHYYNSRIHLDIFCHHGKGAARMVGGSLNRVQQMGEIAEADIYLMGHDHKKPAAFVPKLRLEHSSRSGLMLKHRKQLIARTGSFLKAWEPETPSYVVDACMGPSDLGVTTIELTPIVESSKGKREFRIEMKATI